MTLGCARRRLVCLLAIVVCLHVRHRVEGRGIGRRRRRGRRRIWWQGRRRRKCVVCGMWYVGIGFSMECTVKGCRGGEKGV